MTKLYWRWAVAVFFAAAVGVSLIWTVGRAQASDAPAPAFTSAGELIFPKDYRRWIFLSSGRGMNYNRDAVPEADPQFDNVFADPTAHAAFLTTGHWPEGTMLVLEHRAGTSKGSINRHGAFQTGAAFGVEVHVRDSKRFKGGWGFFAFDGSKPATLIGYDASCYSCHVANAAVDTTFVQFYPTLLPVAAEKRSLSVAYVAAERAQKLP